MRKYSNAIYNAAKSLRSHATEAEQILWNELKSRKLNGFKFRFQVPYDSFILDFLCSSHKLIIEVDGIDHNYHKEQDLERDEYFRSKGYEIIRIENEEVLKNIDKVLNKIKHVLDYTTPKPPM